MENVGQLGEIIDFCEFDSLLRFESSKRHSNVLLHATGNSLVVEIHDDFTAVKVDDDKNDFFFRCRSLLARLFATRVQCRVQRSFRPHWTQWTTRSLCCDLLGYYDRRGQSLGRK